MICGEIMKFKCLILSLCLFLNCLFVSAANIVFDLGGVIVKTGYAQVAYQAGLAKFMAYLVLHQKNPKQLFWRVLNEIDLVDVDDNLKHACDEHGTPLPKGLLHWLSGLSSGPQIIQKVDELLEGNEDYSGIEKAVVKGMVKASFDPALFKCTRSLYQDGIDFVHECKENGHKIYVLSNLDRDSFEELKEMMPGFFDLFDGVVISAEVGYIKPDLQIYQHLLSTYNLDPDKTVFIDDQQENLDAADNTGIYPILCKQAGWIGFKYPDFSAIRQELDDWLELNKNV